LSVLMPFTSWKSQSSTLFEVPQIKDTGRPAAVR